MTMTLPKPLMLAVAFVQGICLFLLYQSIELTLWPATNPIWLFICLSSAITVPTFFLLLIEQGKQHKALICLLPFSLVIIAVSTYAGLQLTPTEFILNSSLIPIFILTIGIASFKALMYAQEYSHGSQISYASLFLNSWRNFLILGLSLLFTLLFFGFYCYGGNCLRSLISISLQSYSGKNGSFFLSAASHLPLLLLFLEAYLKSLIVFQAYSRP